MHTEVIAIFDIGKTNKKILLFDAALRLLFEQESRFEEIPDDDGFMGDDIEKLEKWMFSTLNDIINIDTYQLRALNITTYGASLMYVDGEGNRLTPVYNYLKPMPEEVMDGFYNSNGGKEEFCRKTSSPALGMLNSGLQILWLKRMKPEVFSKVGNIMHLPQYLSYLFTHKVTSEFTSIGCHTAMWDFDRQKYHSWLTAEGMRLRGPVSNHTVYETDLNGQHIHTGIGIHDSSASLVPYFMGTREQFILISTGTWCIFMNPFNREPLTAGQLTKDCLCYMSIRQQPVKSARFFMGQIHDVNVERLNHYFGVSADHFKSVKAETAALTRMINSNTGRVFFRNGISDDYVDKSVNLTRFLTFGDAYKQLMVDLVEVGLESLKLIIPADDQSKEVYISGGFARNDLFVKLLAIHLPGKRVYTTEIDNTTALGAAMVVYTSVFNRASPVVDLGLKKIT